jgi:hypothetical protein
MWFCEMRQMPTLRDCLYEFTSHLLTWFCDQFGLREGRNGTRRPVCGHGPTHF